MDNGFLIAGCLWGFYSDKNDYSPVFIYPFEFGIHFLNGDEVLTYNRYGKRECYLFGMCIFGIWIPDKDTYEEEYISDIFIGTFEN